MTMPMVGGLAGRRFFGVLRRAVALVVLSAAGLAQAALLSLSPQAQTVEQGSVAAVDVWVTGLSGQSIGAYDFWLNFDDQVLGLLSVDAGPSLGHPTDSLLATLEEPGRVNVAELSLLADLSSLQSGTGDLLLFTLRFSALALGTSPLSFSENILGVAGGFLGDELGAAIALTGTQTGSISVVAATPPPPPPPQPPASGVPEPTSLALVVAAVAAALATRRRQRG